ncbi:MAG: hypothetical protein OEQ18_15720, partial [Gammaproteobacteria bacterium]|nr:hypothetical protein [Gammaproteobacteria bacterium]
MSGGDPAVAAKHPPMSNTDRETRRFLAHAERLKLTYGAGVSDEKLSILTALEWNQLPGANDVLRLHELLCFMRAYPDNGEVLSAVERMLIGFARRQDFIRHRGSLADTGIAGTPIYFSFYWQTAEWLCERWPNAISIDWGEFKNKEHLEALWHLLLPYSETLALDTLHLSEQKWINVLKSPTETDATFLIRRFAAMRVDEVTREKIFEDLDVPLRFAPTADMPSRTHSKNRPAKVVFCRGLAKPRRPRVAIVERFRRKPSAIRYVSAADGQRLIDLARVQMVTRHRDLYGFMNADRHDVRVLSYADGLQFVCYGVRPEHRLMLEALYVFLILKNGIPIGYTQASSLFRSAEVNFNVFDTFRRAETAHIFVTTLAMVHHLFAADAFIINTQQLGQDNLEALKSGAFWFYHKHGFRPQDPAVWAIMKEERARSKSTPGHRSSLATLRKLSTDNMFLFTGKPRPDVISRI